MSKFSRIEPLEARIAPAVVINNPIPDIAAGFGKTGATIDLSKMVAPAATSAHRTIIQFVTNFDTSAATPGIQKGVIEVELYDDLTPYSVQNFLSYFNNLDLTRDYDGTIFHRSADLGNGTNPAGDPAAGYGGAGNDIIQGGGFQFPGFTHIPAGATVHNEFNASRPNAAYTIAMAKVGGDPNSATSEWFFNKNDNTNTLGAGNNGGFTVFGKVNDAASRAVIDGIAALTKQNFGGALGELPLQNYNADPDNNPSTPKPAPTANQVIRILETKVVPKAATSTTGLTFTVESIFNQGTTTKSDLVSASVTGSKLVLKYAVGKSGLADVTVKVSDGTSSKTDTFRVDVRPNLIARIDKDALPTVIVPGDAATLSFRVTNNLAGTASGLTDIKISLAKTNPDGSLIVSSGGALTLIPLTTLTNVNFSLAGGASKTFAPKVQIPTTLAATSGEGYRVIVDLDPKGGTAAAERYTDDDVALNGSTHELVNAFGTFSATLGSRTNAVLKQSATDVQGHATIVSWSLKGGGFGTLTPNGKTLQTSNTGAASTLSATVPAGSAHVKLNGLNFGKFIGTAALGPIDVGGAVIATEGIKALTLGDLTGQALMLIGQQATNPDLKTTITLGDVRNFSLQSDMPIATLSAKSWIDTAGTAGDAITAPSLGALRVTTGDFEADVTLSENSPTAAISIKGFLRNAVFKTDGNIGAIILGGITGSRIFAGVDSAPTTLAGLADARSIAKFTIAGITGSTANLFVSSQVVAKAIGEISVQRVAQTTGAGDFGFLADAIGKYSRLNGPTRLSVTTPQTFDDLGEYSVRVL